MQKDSGYSPNSERYTEPFGLFTQRGILGGNVPPINSSAALSVIDLLAVGNTQSTVEQLRWSRPIKTASW